METATNTIESTCRLFEIVEDEQVFKPCKRVNQMHGNFMQIEMHQDSDDGTFPRVSDYIRLINRMEKDGTSEYITWISSSKSKKLVSDIGYCTITRESNYDSEAVLTFKKPIKIIIGELNDEPVIIEANRITGEFTHEWFWIKSGGRQNKYANGFEVWFDCKKYELI